MANFIVFKDFLTATINSESSELTGWESTSILNPDRQTSYWQTSGTGNSWVILDLGSAQALTSVALINVNYTNVVIEGDTTNSFASPPTTSGTLTVPLDPGRGRYYLHSDPSTYGTTFNHQFLRVYIPTQSTTDGASNFKTGGIVLQTGTNTILINPEQELDMNIGRTSDVVDLRSGRREVRNIGDRLANITLSFDRDVRTEAQVDELFNLFSTIDETEMLFMYDNGNFLAKPTNSPFMYVLRREENTNFRFSGYSGFRLENMSLREQI